MSTPPEFVYFVAFVDPLDSSVDDERYEGHVRYIKACRDAEKTIQGIHKGSSTTSNARIRDLIIHRRVQGFPIELHIVDKVVHQGDDKTWRKVHKKLVDAHRRLGHQLENKIPGAGSLLLYDKRRPYTRKRMRRKPSSSPYLTNETRFAAKARYVKFFKIQQELKKKEEGA